MQRVKGQDVEIMVAAGGQPQFTIGDIKDAEFTFKFDIVTDEYLGETQPRKDEVPKGYTGRMQVHLETEDIFAFVQALTDRARRRNTTFKVNIKATLNFPGGDRPRLIFYDAYFADVPMAIGGRSDYVGITLNFEGADWRRLN